MFCSVLGLAGHPGHLLQAPLLRLARRVEGTRDTGRRSKCSSGAIRQAAKTSTDGRPVEFPAGSQSQADRHHGHRLGGIIAAAAAGAEPRLYRTGLILAGGDVLAIIHHSANRDLAR